MTDESKEHKTADEKIAYATKVIEGLNIILNNPSADIEEERLKNLQTKLDNANKTKIAAEEQKKAEDKIHKADKAIEKINNIITQQKKILEKEKNHQEINKIDKKITDQKNNKKEWEEKRSVAIESRMKALQAQINSAEDENNLAALKKEYLAAKQEIKKMEAEKIKEKQQEPVRMIEAQRQQIKYQHKAKYSYELAKSIDIESKIESNQYSKKDKKDLEKAKAYIDDAIFFYEKAQEIRQQAGDPLTQKQNSMVTAAEGRVIYLLKEVDKIMPKAKKKKGLLPPAFVKYLNDTEDQSLKNITSEPSPPPSLSPLKKALQEEIKKLSPSKESSSRLTTPGATTTMPSQSKKIAAKEKSSLFNRVKSKKTK